MPFVRAPTSYLLDEEYVPIISGFKKDETSPPVLPEISVFIIIFAAPSERGANMFMVDPPLKNSQHTKSRNVPKTTKGNELMSWFSS